MSAKVWFNGVEISGASLVSLGELEIKSPSLGASKVFRFPKTFSATITVNFENIHIRTRTRKGQGIRLPFKPHTAKDN